MSDQDQIIEEQKRAVKKNKHENKVDYFSTITQMMKKEKQSLQYKRTQEKYSSQVLSKQDLFLWQSRKKAFSHEYQKKFKETFLKTRYGCVDFQDQLQW